ncbi:MAG: helix-turn-helix domain-containing protein [Lachnospiraceae bacterium]
MNQVKIGEFLRELRKGKGLTQEQLAEQFNISRRSVSRWETGSNLPDLDILIEMADYYGVELKEILNGERKSEKMNAELKETVLKVAEFSNEDKRKLTERMNKIFIAGLVAAVIYIILFFTDNADNLIGGLSLGITFGMMIVGVIITSKNVTKIRKMKMRIVNKLNGRGE